MIKKLFLGRTLVGCLCMMLAIGWMERRSFADAISFSPSVGNALTPMTVNVSGFTGTNGPAAVDINGSGIVGSCSSVRPCSFAANMGYFSGKYWVVAAALVDGVNVVVSNYFVVRDAGAYINRACGTNGTKVLVTGRNFARNISVMIDSTQVMANSNGNFTATVTIPEGANGTYKIVASDGFRAVTNSFVISPTSELCGEEIGHVTEVRGNPTIQPPNGPAVPLKLGDPVRFGDQINTGAGDGAELFLSDQTMYRLGENTRVSLDNYAFNPAAPANDQSAIRFLQGVAGYVSGIMEKNNDRVQIDTDYAALGIRGTEFILRRDPCSTTQEVHLIHGQLAIKPTNSATTNIIDAPATIYITATNVWTNVLNQAAFDTLSSQLSQANPVTFASWQAQYFGCTNDNAAALALADPDHDGQNNAAEFLSRTDPTQAASVFKMLDATPEGEHVRVYWQTHGGVTNIVQAAPDPIGTFTNLSAAVFIPGNSDVVTNHLDVGALTNAASRFYRIQLTP